MDIVKTAGLLIRRMTLAMTIMIAAAGAASADNFGAIAYSNTTGAYGYSYDHRSRGSAEVRAMSECRARGRGCKVAIWFKNACGSVAAGSNGWGSAWASTRRDAERAAIRNCSRYTGGCRTVAWTCTSR